MIEGCHGRNISVRLQRNPDSAGHRCMRDLARAPGCRLRMPGDSRGVTAAGTEGQTEIPGFQHDAACAVDGQAGAAHRRPGRQLLFGHGGGIGAVPCGFPAGQVPERHGMFIS